MTTKNILLCITGLSPQVMTETLFAIHENNLPWPDEIQVITTKTGKEKLLNSILKPNKKERNPLEQFCNDYKKDLPTFSDSCIFVVPNANGRSVDDARTFEDQEALADFIVAHVGNLCSNKNTSVHASIAGGRKTMTFYLGYAMTLFAREHDRLSHVLVSREFENVEGFYYPTPFENFLKHPKTNLPLDCSKAKITLAEIPFIRQRKQLHKRILESLESQSYRELVYFQNATNTIENIKVKIHRRQRQIDFDGKTVDFGDKALELAFYCMFADQVKVNGFCSIKRPKQNENSKYLTNLLLKQLELICGLKPIDCSDRLLKGDDSNYKQTYKDRALLLTEQDLVRGPGIQQDISQTYLDLQFGLDSAFFNDRLTLLKNHLLQFFPKDYVLCIMPSQVYEKDNHRVKREYSLKGQQGTPYGFWLENDNIRFIN